MKQHDVFPGKYLKAADLNGSTPTVTIAKVVMEEVGDGMKPICYFVGKEKGLVLNKTNFSAIEDLAGEEDTDNWPGAKIMLITAKVEFQGKRVPAIRIEAPAGAAPRPVPVQTQADDDIPF